MSSAEQLSRTILLLKGDLGIADDETVLRALVQPTIQLVADADVVNCRSGQIALTTAAMLASRSGHRVFVDAPDAPLIGSQPPMRGATLHEAIGSIADKMIDGVVIAIGCPLLEPDIAFVFGDGNAGVGVRAKRIVSVGWSRWSATLTDWPIQSQGAAEDWPFGAMAAAAFVAAETFKISGRVLLPLSPHAAEFRERFLPASRMTFALAPVDTPISSDVGMFDVISAGAVSNAFMFALGRVPNVRGSGRSFDGDLSEQTNRNRNLFLLPEGVGLPKVDLFDVVSGLSVTPILRHFAEADLATLAERVVVGVDDIPTRWLLASANVPWMGVGATTHFSSMASVHYAYSACAACLHPYDEEQAGPTPTVAFVSFLAGLQVAADFLRDVARSDIGLMSRQMFVTPFRPDTAVYSRVPPISHCPAGCSASLLKRA